MNKVLSVDDIVDGLENGMTVGIGGWGSRRKPMAVVRAICRSSVRDLTLVSYGGPDVGHLAAAGKLRKVVHGFVSLDTIAIEPHFARRREAGRLEVEELDEHLLLTGLRAAAQRLPFQVVRTGLGSDILRASPRLRTVRSPYDDEELLAMPALTLDVALLHVNQADERGNCAFTGPDPYFDDLYAMAAQRTFVTTEQLVPVGGLDVHPTCGTLVNRAMVHGVAHVPGGAHPTACVPDYPRDEEFQRHYAASASPEDWATYRDRFVALSEGDYQDEVTTWRGDGR